MKTSDLIEALAATDSAPVRPTSPAARLIPAVIAGALVSAAILGFALGFQPLAPAARASWFWMKLGYGAVVALAGLAITIPLARPAGRSHLAGYVIIGVAIAAIWMMAMHAAMRADASAQAGLWLGHTWKVCPLRIAGLAAPVWLAAAFTLRRLAPTRLALVGAASGLMAGGLSVVVYGLYCQETAAPFVAVWYSLGIAASAGGGWLLGPRLLRW